MNMSRSRAWVPSVLVVVPLVGLAFVSDERRNVYLRALTDDANPVTTAEDAARGIDGFIAAGNFRPIGRFWEMLVHGFVYEAGEATAVAPHFILGIIRIAMVALVALGATAMISALMRSAGVHEERSLVGMYPLALGAVLIASGPAGALAQFPHTLIGSVALMFAMTLAISRDRDLQQRSLRWWEYAAVAASGVVAASFYDLSYLTPLVAALFLIARALASRMTLHAILATAAARRLMVHSIGFALVFVPARVGIAFQCSRGDCYVGSDLSLSTAAAGATLRRLLTGLPPFGWDRAAGRARSARVELGFLDFGGNALVALIVIGVAAAAVTAARQRPVAARNEGLLQSGNAVERPTVGSNRLAVSLLVLGGPMAVLSASLGGLSAWAQQRQPPIGQAWRETLLTQVAWSIVAIACLAALDGVLRSGVAVRTVRAVVAAALALALATTLLANWRFAEISRRDSAAVLTGLVSLSSVNIDDTDNGNTLRCDLISAYVDATTDQPAWKAGQAIGDNLNDLWLARLGLPYCDPSQLTHSPATAR